MRRACSSWPAGFMGESLLEDSASGRRAGMREGMGGRSSCSDWLVSVRLAADYQSYRLMFFYSIMNNQQLLPQQWGCSLQKGQCGQVYHNPKFIKSTPLGSQSLIQLMEQSTLNFIYFLAVIGAVVFVLWIAKILWALLKAVLPAKDFKERYGLDSWAVVTGGSDGIGLAFCKQLASLGFNIVMVARNKAKMEQALEKIAADLDPPIKTKCIVADFVDADRPELFEGIARSLNGLDVSILVNNVGISNIGIFHEIPAQRIRHEINVNVMAMTMMTHAVIGGMLAREKRSAVINVSSVAGENPIPFISTYSATKAYNDFLSQSLTMEYAHKVDVLSLRPMYVESNLSKMEKSCTVASAQECAQSALKYLGVDYETNGYYMHRLLSYITSCLPTPILRCIAESESRKIMEAEQKPNPMSE